jgi:hypothetical protein
MRIPRSWTALVGLGAVAAGCAQSPSASRPDVTLYRLQEVTLDWRGGGWAEPPMPGPNTAPRRTSGGWGQHYPWRGPGERPAWYGVHPHVPDRLVRIGQHYYPYYFEGGQIYPVYSMPHTLNEHGFTPDYGPLPAFGPAVVAPANAQLFHRTR